MMQESDEFITNSEITGKNCRLYKQHKSKEGGDKRSSHCLRNCLQFCFKKRKNMEQRGLKTGPSPEPTSSNSTSEGGLRELTSTWFIQSQAPLISQNGLFPNWFLGFISRTDAEDILKEKQIGCFLIRLSDKALGYILSYRGRDRCRHFVINQSESGQYIVHGDVVGHDTISDLIEYFKEKPIKPFREYLTTSCFGTQNEALYDTIQVSSKERPVANVHALKANKQQSSQGLDQVLPGNRQKKRTEEVPALPRRSRHLETGSTSENPDMVCYAQVRPRKCRERQLNGEASGNLFRPPSAYSEVDLLDSRSRSMPLLLSNTEEQNYRLSVTPPLPSRDTPSPEVSNRGPSICPSPEPSYGRPLSALSLDIYRLASQPEHCPPVDDTYEQIPVERSPYEPVGILRAKHEPSAGGAKSDKWKQLFPDIKRKW